jgi:hypothetical protein
MDYRNVCLTILEVGKFMNKVLRNLVSDEDLFFTDGTFELCPHMVEVTG